MEIWKDIPNYEGIYQASTFGNVRTIEGKTTYTEWHGERKWKSRVLKGRGDNKTTGKRVSLWKDGKCKSWLVARLVAITFLGEPKYKATVNHKDGNRLNNKIENLEWLSLADNIRHGFETGLYRTQKPIKLKNEEKFFEFRSLSQCDKFLRKNSGYTSSMIIKGKNVLINIEGHKYNIVPFE